MVFRKILIAIDGSEHAWKALEVATELARVHGAGLVVLHVAQRPALPDTLRMIAELEHIPLEEEVARYEADLRIGDALVREVIARAKRAGVEVVRGEVAEGHPPTQILEVASREGCDTIPLGSRGLGEARSLLLGSVSHKVAHLSETTCIIVK